MNKNHIRIAAATAVIAVALGVAAPAASAVEAHREAKTASQTAEPLRPTADDVRDLVSRMLADGADKNQIREFEQYAKQLEDPTAQERILGSGTVIRKLIVAGLRHGGVWAGKSVGKVSKKADDFLARNGAKIADAIEDVEGWSETALALAMVHAGVPADIAADLAKAIMLIAV
ncbi:hypothetical protein [Streptomyces sp. WAC 06783]|uniref:hypothetical protein n=1 Tax=Streptomyces sp. WAC 06783 TaxID=2203211 RepID=UPI0021ADEA66|nr:hypothetical protein [Streptomyces sp. WAC 06783]